MTETRSLEYHLRYIQGALEVLERYLLSEDVFWPIGVNPPDGDPDYPRLTLDGLLLAQVRSEAYPKSPEQQGLVERISSDLELMRSKWRVAWEKKASQSYRVRMRMWGDFIQEYKDNPQDNADRYGYEVRLRVMLNLLKSEIGLKNSTEVELLYGLDGYLKSMLLPGSFIWEPEVRAGFPPGEYWYLYGQLPPIVKVQPS